MKLETLVPGIINAIVVDMNIFIGPRPPIWETGQFHGRGAVVVVVIVIVVVIVAAAVADVDGAVIQTIGDLHGIPPAVDVHGDDPRSAVSTAHSLPRSDVRVLLRGHAAGTGSDDDQRHRDAEPVPDPGESGSRR